MEIGRGCGANADTHARAPGFMVQLSEVGLGATGLRKLGARLWGHATLTELSLGGNVGRSVTTGRV